MESALTNEEWKDYRKWKKETEEAVKRVLLGCLQDARNHGIVNTTMRYENEEYRIIIRQEPNDDEN